MSLTPNECEALIQADIAKRLDNNLREWWEPLYYSEDEQARFNSPQVAFLDDHLGDAYSRGIRMWAEILKLRKQLEESK